MIALQLMKLFVFSLTSGASLNVGNFVRCYSLNQVVSEVLVLRGQRSTVIVVMAYCWYMAMGRTFKSGILSLVASLHFTHTDVKLTTVCGLCQKYAGLGS